MDTKPDTITTLLQIPVAQRELVMRRAELALQIETTGNYSFNDSEQNRYSMGDDLSRDELRDVAFRTADEWLQKSLDTLPYIP